MVGAAARNAGAVFGAVECSDRLAASGHSCNMFLNRWTARAVASEAITSFALK
jgi:hypothetical protein